MGLAHAKVTDRCPAPVVAALCSRAPHRDKIAPRVAPRTLGGVPHFVLRAWPRSAPVASRRHLTSAQPPTPMTLTPRGNDQTSDQPNAALDTPHPVRHSSPSFSTKVMQPTFRPHRKKRARKIGYRARMATPGGRKVIRARRLKGRKRLTVV